MSDWPEEWFTPQGVCNRHAELACPSCLKYALNDARTRLAAAERDLEREKNAHAWTTGSNARLREDLAAAERRAEEAERAATLIACDDCGHRCYDYRSKGGKRRCVLCEGRLRDAAEARATAEAKGADALAGALLVALDAMHARRRSCSCSGKMSGLCGPCQRVLRAEDSGSTVYAAHAARRAVGSKA